MPGGVFICYRREETAFAARAIHDRVVQRLERENVFLDVDNIDLGVDWSSVLTERVGGCDALVAVIGRNWVSSADKDNRRRLDDPDDFVRIEIEAALKRNVRVIPVLVDGATMPKASELPDTLKGLARRQGTEVSPSRFEADVEKLTRALVSILDERRRRDAAEADAARQAEEERRAQKVAEAERVAREESGRREAAEAARAKEARRLAEAESARRAANERQVEDERRAREAAEAEQVAREERERPEAIEATAERVAEARRPVEAESARQSKEDDRPGWLSGTRAIGALSGPRSPPVRTYSPMIAVAIAVGVAAALAILAATFGSPVWKFSAPADDKVAEQAAADKAAADKAAADKAAADKAAAEKAAADKVAADKAVADRAAADKAAAGKAAAGKAAADKAAADKAAASESPLTVAQEGVLKPGDSFKECADCPEMVVVPAGRFLMGSPAGRGDPWEHPQHEVTIANPFAVAKFAVTFDEWDACAARGGCRRDVSDSGFGRGRRPAIEVTWDDAQAYVTWLSSTTSKPYRLLSEAEYEYAARAGSQTAYPWGDDIKLNGMPMANCWNGCGSQWDGKRTAPVGSFAANAFGLYDMVGNALAWTEDCWNPSYQGAPDDGSPWTSGDCSRRLIRGGQWAGPPDFVRSALRGGAPTTAPPNNRVEFRVARTLSH